MGHEWSGEVVALGEGLEDLELQPGDRWWPRTTSAAVAVPCAVRAGTTCVRNPALRDIGSTDSTAPGALAEFAVRPAQMLHKLPDSISPLEEGALVNQGSLTVHALRRVEFLPGSSVAISDRAPRPSPPWRWRRPPERRN